MGSNGETIHVGDEIDGGKRSAWLAHVKKTMKMHKGKPLRKILPIAAKSYKGKTRKTRRGGGGLSPLPLNGAGRKGSRRRH